MKTFPVAHNINGNFGKLFKIHKTPLLSLKECIEQKNRVIPIFHTKLRFMVKDQEKRDMYAFLRG